jgi:hypothetical protein
MRQARKNRLTRSARRTTPYGDGRPLGDMVITAERQRSCHVHSHYLRTEHCDGRIA